MKVHYDEGVATHIGPEPCIVVRENGGEASAGEGIGQVLSPENYVLPERRRVTHRGRQYGQAQRTRGLNGPAWSKTLACAEAPCAGTGRSHDRPPAVRRRGPYREGEEP